MDVEKGRMFVESGGRGIGFVDLRYELTSQKGLIKKTSTDLDNGQVILNGASGAIRPGRLTFILGPSGAGKTTLMNILAGRKKTGVTGALYGAGKKAVLVAQHATLIDTLTAFETLQFAARLKLPSACYRERHQAIESVSNQLGILDVLKTRTNRLSGGERKRLTIACELLTDPYIMLLDEPTSGLDSVSSMSVVQALRTVAHTGRTVACVIHQPSSKLYASADDIILVSNGKTLYSGGLTDIPDALSRAGFTCPPFYNMADYLLEIASGEHSGNLSVLDNEIRNYAYEMRAAVKNEVYDDREKDPEAEALLNSVQPYSAGYPASFCQQLGALLWRCTKGVLRDVYLTQIRMACHIIVALLLGALYAGAGAEAGRVLSNTSCLFFFILFLFFSNAMPTVQTFPIEKEVVLQEHLNKWYSLHAYCLAKILIDIPFQLLCATVFIIPVWYITSQPLDFYRFGLMWFLCALLTVLAQSFGLAMGAAVGVKMGLFLVPATNIPMLMFSEFFIPYREMPVYLRPFASISYFRYALDAAVASVYGFGRPKLPCNQIYCMFKDPKYLIEHLGLTCDFVADIAVILVWIVLLQIIFMLLLKYKAYSACR